jgi:hypothetical protein
MAMMPHADLQREFAARGPWVTGFEIDGRHYGSRDFTPDGMMEQEARWQFPAARTVLELGTLEGGRTRHLAHWARHVHCVDARPENLARAAWIMELFGLDNVTLLPAHNLESGLPALAAPPDLIYCVGLLYHLPRPWELIGWMAAFCPNLFLWTHVCEDANATEERSAWRFTPYREHGRDDVLSGMSSSSLWPTRETLRSMLESSGYVVTVIQDDTHKHGPAMTLACRRPAP